MTKEHCALVMDKEVQQFIKKEASYLGRKHPSIGEEEFKSIGNEAACLNSVGYDKENGVPFLLYIRKYVILEMVQRIRKDVYGIHYENNAYVCTDVQMIEDIKFGRNESDKENEVSNDEKLSILMEDLDDESRAKWKILEPLIDGLTDEEKEIVFVRFGFFDNHGEALEEYLKKHKMSKPVFYRKAEAAVQKMRDLANKND